MKKLLILIFLMLISGCASTPTISDSVSVPIESTTSHSVSLQEYLSETREYIEPVCKEWENGTFVFEDKKLFKKQANGTTQEIFNNVVTWTALSDHSLLIVNDNSELVEIDTETDEISIIYQFSEQIKGINTNGILLFWYTETQIYRYYIPDKVVDLIATDEMLLEMVSPLSTTDICWSSYNPLWLKKYYEYGTDVKIIGINPTYTVFCDTKTKNTYKWKMDSPEDSYLVQGVDWYERQRDAKVSNITK